MRRTRLFYLWMLTVLVPVLTFGQAAQVMDYNSFLKRVTTVNPISQKARNIKTYGETQLRAAKGAYDPVLSGSYSSKNFQGSNYFSLLSGEIRQPVLTSQYIKAGYDMASGIRVNPQEYTPVQGIPFLGVEADLLQGLLIDKRRSDLLKAREYRQYFEAEGNIELNELLFYSAEAYITWLYFADQAKVEKRFLEASLLRFGGVRELALAGERAPLDTIEAGTQVQSRQMEYQAALIKSGQEINHLLFFLSSAVSPDATENFVRSDSLDLYYESCKNDPVLIEKKPDITNPALARYEARKKILAIESRFRKEMIKPRLNLSYNFLAAQSTENVFMLSPNNYKWGLSLSYPILMRNALNEYKLSKLDLDNTDLELVNKRNELNTRMRAIRNNLVNLQSQLAAAELNVKLSKAMLEAEELKFSAGESSLFLLNSRENKLLETELGLLELKYRFILTVLNARYLRGDLDYSL